MKLLAELSEKSLGINPQQNIFGGSYKLRKSARAIILNHEGSMALQHIQKYNYHKLPGGGMEEGEEITETLTRELREEVGCTATNIEPIGVIIEYHQDYIHISYGYSAEVSGEISEPQFDLAEIENNQCTIWLKPTECLGVLKNDLLNKKQGDFILQREITFLTEYLTVQKSKQK